MVHSLHYEDTCTAAQRTNVDYLKCSRVSLLLFESCDWESGVLLARVKQERTTADKEVSGYVPLTAAQDEWFEENFNWKQAHAPILFSPLIIQLYSKFNSNQCAIIALMIIVSRSTDHSIKTNDEDSLSVVDSLLSCAFIDWPSHVSSCLCLC